ncbi:MAG: hypothetical protein Q9162_006605 [Coniocarpon cinnabarinum]
MESQNAFARRSKQLDVLVMNSVEPRRIQQASPDNLLCGVARDSVSQKDSTFLSVLPVEIRRLVYQFLLPTTVPLRDLISGGVAHVWVQGNTAILATCQQVYEETTNILYGESMFIIEVGYDSITLRHRRLLESGLVPEATPTFLELLSPSNMRRIRHLAINIKHVDSYTDGLRDKVQELVDALQNVERLKIVRINLDDRNRDIQRAQTVLRPFQKLRNFDSGSGLLLTGDITPDFARNLVRCVGIGAA